MLVCWQLGIKKLTKRCLRWPSEGWSSEGWRWSSGALKSFLQLEVSPCISMITTFNTLHFYSLVHFELGHSLSFMPCFVITVLLKMYQQLLHQATYEQVHYSKLDKFFSARANVLVNKVFIPFTPIACTLLVELVEVQRSQFLLSACEDCHRCFTPLARLPPLARRSHNKSSML